MLRKKSKQNISANASADIGLESKICNGEKHAIHCILYFNWCCILDANNISQKDYIPNTG